MGQTIPLHTRCKLEHLNMVLPVFASFDAADMARANPKSLGDFGARADGFPYLADLLQGQFGPSVRKRLGRGALSLHRGISHRSGPFASVGQGRRGVASAARPAFYSTISGGAH